MAKNYYITPWYKRGYYWLRTHLRHDYKDRLFCRVFRDKRDLLDLYNAIQGTTYTNIDDLEVVTLEDVIYMRMHNDVSFIVGGKLNLYEHQSTVNHNMPLRGLLYFARQYEGIIEGKEEDIYRRSIVKIPTPEYIVFYNGIEEMPEEEELYLSDAFLDGRGSGCLECKCRIFNINRGNHEEIMLQCKRLGDYSEFTSLIAEYRKQGLADEEAVQRAIDECIEREILSDILIREKAEVTHMLLTEYNEKRHMKYLRAEGYEDGRKEGISQGIFQRNSQLVSALIRKGKSSEEIADLLDMTVEDVERISGNLQK